ncbi:MAG: flagellar protein [Defluviitaleaceae bacterium]|nr:flagellar protein [Defluviitaleaceae bacterium]MCL2273787.1 flagellar protein [Defluviitaleaceae bacterium]
MPQNCPRCGKMFSREDSPICKDCVKAEAEKFEEVRLFVKENPLSSAQEVSETCGVSVKRLLHYVREGKLEIATGLEGMINCSKCGRPIKNGRMCDRCAKGTASALEGIMAVNKAQAEAKKNTTGMFTNR